MAPRLTPGQARGAERRGQVRRQYTGDTPCTYCAGGPTLGHEIVPAEYQQGRLVHKAHTAPLCFDCALRLRVAPVTSLSTSDMVRMRKERLAWERAERRGAMWAKQTQLFDTDPGPSNAITGGNNE